MKLKLYTTIFENQEKKTEEKILEFEKDQEEENNVVNIYPEVTYQIFQGFGGAITDASGYIYSLMNEEQKHMMLKTYFSKDEMNYQMVRIHMDSCDFSLEHFEAMSDSEDKEFQSFDVSRSLKYIYPLFLDAQNYCDKPLEIMLSPWSPPVFMKTNGDRNNGGKLKKEYYKMWAQYICKYINWFLEHEHKVERVSIQNEPKAIQTWDSCVYSSEEEKEFLRDYLYPTLKEYQLEYIEILFGIIIKKEYLSEQKK